MQIPWTRLSHHQSDYSPENSLLAIQLNGAESQFAQRRLVFRLHPQLAFQCKT